MKYCGQCGHENADSARFCTECGAKLRVREEENVNVEGNANADQATEKAEYAGTVSPLSITGFVFAFLIAPVGFILELIDLCICDGRKKGLSIAGLIISLLILTVIFFAIFLPIKYMMS